MKTDTLFYRLFEAFPGIFFELINRSPEEAENYQFASVEVKQLSFRIDGVFIPNLNATNPPIYFAEVQFQSDSRFYSRFFAEIFLYLNKTDLINDWRGVVLYPSRNIDPGETPRYQELFHAGRVSLIYLDELGEIAENSVGIATVQLIVAQQEQAIPLAQSLIERVRAETFQPQSQTDLLQLIEAILVYKLPQLSREELEAMFSLNDLKQTRFYQEAFAEGREEGRQEARQEGRQEAKLELVPFLISLGISLEEIAVRLGLELEQVQQAIQSSTENQTDA
ncbi:Rpn family recombination-promoting nuclease/putative transposase [Limnoraphis robusta]|uniref:Rpn family recombination-promoting nuclease/putative transposase n=1 Tax=Limnoraphis robusta CCNP1315 TaxID=3110306 RepID=A0ABU5TTP6_9CYAN|nr:Rpn family recombination-promoting nuclease/putative transposase [Limnoraphis robusta]MEA5518001.1 Rpn family recombination-promoting nuclease/putative transposase [Limnoraphis robusta CCNP1315]MEA5547270.1 Rpn family recombination-promoting nuclease/putative transposase [Limnoraphis robusta CCNP1324]